MLTAEFRLNPITGIFRLKEAVLGLFSTWANLAKYSQICLTISRPSLAKFRQNCLTFSLNELAKLRQICLTRSKIELAKFRQNQAKLAKREKF